MSEESHLEEMRSAIRGDFARLAERRGDQELMQVSDVSEAPLAETSAQREAAPESDRVPSLATDEVAELPRRSWLARLVSS